MSLPAMTFGEQKRRDRGSRVGAPKGADSMAVSGLHFGNALVGSGWATAVLLCRNGLREQSSHRARHTFPAGKPLSQSGRAVAG